MKNKLIKSGAIGEVIMLIISSIAFAFIIGGMSIGIIEEASAVSDLTSILPKGCCLEAKDGSICQDMNKYDEGLCKESLLPTECNYVDQCQSGCCYDPEEGICSFNSPKEKCLTNRGNWTKNPSCNIPQCTIGCCILGEQASITTSRECTKLSAELNFDKNFQNLNMDGTCRSYTGLSQKGACITPASDYTGKNDCKFETKNECKTGTFYEGYLCTSKELNTNCFPSQKTTCLSDKDQVYFLDSCNNIANIYDASKLEEQSYWETILPASEICNNAGSDCGNCDYLKGSVCNTYRQGKDAKPTYGDKVCRDLSCSNGKKHGESWCIDDYSNIDDFGISPVGSRSYIGKCLEGEIIIEQCADYNQAICASQVSEGFSEAKCIVNEWRSCLNANSKETYGEVERECKKYDQCIMFLDIPGNEKYEGLPGFDKTKTNNQQGSAGDVGKDTNPVLAHCVPKFAPGFVFWQTEQKSLDIFFNSSRSSKSYSGLDSGGSYLESQALCSLGSFTCVSHTQNNYPDNPSSAWEDMENPACNINAIAGENRDKVPLLMEALNERCRSIGSCGLNVNVAGELGDYSVNSSIKRVKVNVDGKEEKISSVGYELAESYLENLKSKAKIKKIGSITSLTGAVILNWLTGNMVGQDTSSADYLNTVSGASGAVNNNPANNNGAGQVTSGISTLGGLWGSISSIGLLVGTEASGAGTGTIYAGGVTNPLFGGMPLSTTSSLPGSGVSGGSTTSVGAGGTALGYLGSAAVGAVLGYYLGGLIAKSGGMSPGETEAFVGIMTGIGAIAGVVVYGVVAYMALEVGQTLCATGYGCIVGGVIIAVAIAYILYAWLLTGEDNEFYILEYKCEPWQAPLRGDCSLCNNDVRTCSEYRCKSLGQNCKYYTDNGEPGVCASLSDTWSAKITPWQEALALENKYTEIKERSFKIEGKENEKVSSSENLQFGIVTDELATCKLDTIHTQSYDEMRFNFDIDSSLGCAGENCKSQGKYHKIIISPHVNRNSSTSLTPGLNEGDNNYYIRCRNFAGATNEAEFVVKIIRNKEDDRTPPVITRFFPEDSSYLKKDSNSSKVVIYINEPSECRYSQNVNNRFEEMTGNVTCMTNPDFGFKGEWMCYSELKDLKVGANKFYFQCQDQPNIYERVASRRNINRNSKEYFLSVCSTGLKIESLEPKNEIIIGKSPVSASIGVKTSGCIQNGKSTCYYRFEGGKDIAFLNTNSNIHSQVFTNMPAGFYNVSITCRDEAENIDKSSLILNISLDNTEPIVLRAYDSSKQLLITTNENSQCKFTNNKTIGCDFTFNDTEIISMEGSEKIHSTEWKDNKDYFVKCMDVFGNENKLCGIIVRTY